LARRSKFGDSVFIHLEKYLLNNENVKLTENCRRMSHSLWVGRRSLIFPDGDEVLSTLTQEDSLRIQQQVELDKE